MIENSAGPDVVLDRTAADPVVSVAVRQTVNAPSHTRTPLAPM